MKFTLSPPIFFYILIILVGFSTNMNSHSILFFFKVPAFLLHYFCIICICTYCILCILFPPVDIILSVWHEFKRNVTSYFPVYFPEHFLFYISVHFPEHFSFNVLVHFPEHFRSTFRSTFRNFRNRVQMYNIRTEKNAEIISRQAWHTMVRFKAECRNGTPKSFVFYLITIESVGKDVNNPTVHSFYLI